MAKYSLVCIYTKKGNLLPYFGAKETHFIQGRFYSSPQAKLEHIQRLHNHYAQEREIQLIAMFRLEGSKCFCKIKCPVNPLPVKGEFEVPCHGAIASFLKANGWTFKQKIHPNMFE